MLEETGSPEAGSEPVEAVSQEDSAVEEVEAEAVEAEETEAEQVEEETTEGEEDQAEESEVSLIDVEYEGQQYQVPPELKDALMRERDYTKKTTELSEVRQTFESEKRAFQELQNASAEHFGMAAEIAAIDRQLGQFSQVDWNAIYDSDPVEAMKLDRQYRGLAEARQQAETRLNQAKQQAFTVQQQQLAKAREQCRQTVAKEIPGWSPELDMKLSEYAESNGYSKEKQARITNPNDVKILHKAMLYDQLQEKRAAKPAPKPVKPASKVKGKQPAAKDPEKMGTEEWVRWREAQLAKKSA